MSRLHLVAVVAFLTATQPSAQASESDYVHRWVASHGGCAGSAATLADHPRGNEDGYYLDLAGPDWNEDVLVDYARVLAECRAQARTGDPKAEPTGDDRLTGFNDMAELKSQWVRYVQDAPVRSAQMVTTGVGLPVGIGALRDHVRQYMGQKVRTAFIIGCFTYSGKYVCAPIADSMFGSVMVVADDLTGADWKQAIDAQCGNMRIARSYRCRPARVSFIIDAYDTDITGTVRIVRTKSISAEGNLPQ